MTASNRLSGISIHALHEESDHYRDGHRHVCQPISIHALHEESDDVAPGLRDVCRISIHALHEESDMTSRMVLLR